MIGIDTNVLVRFLVADDKEQAARAADFMASLTTKEKGHLSVIVLVEAFWVLSRGYALPGDEIVRAFRALLSAPELEVAHPDAVREALSGVEGGFDFADALIARLHQEAGCSTTVTFDKKAGRLPGMRVLRAARPTDSGADPIR